MIQRINRNQNQKLVLMLLPLVLLLVMAATLGATSIGQAKAWPVYKWYQPVGCPYSCAWNAWYQHAKANGWQQGYDDGSQNLAYSCDGHSDAYCATYGEGYTSGQNNYNNNQDQDQGIPSQTQGQDQQQSSTSTSYAQSNPTIKIYNVLPGSAAGSDPSYGNQDPK